MRKLLFALLLIPALAQAQYFGPVYNPASVAITGGTAAFTGTVSTTGNLNVQGLLSSTQNTQPAGTTNSGVALSAAPNVADVLFFDSTQSANNRTYETLAFQGCNQFRFKNDAGNSATAWLSACGGQAAGITGVTASGPWTFSSPIASYNGVATVANGVPVEIAKADAVAQTANIASSTLYAVPSAGAGMYRVSCYLTETTAATTSSTLPACSVGWTDNDSGVALLNNTVTPTNTANAAGAYGPGVTVINAKASTNITFSTTGYVSSGATAMAYAAHVKLQYMGN